MNILNKAILVIETPKRCSMCEFLKRTDEKYCYCGRLGFDYQINEYMTSTPKGKPDWCPVKNIPEKKKPRRIYDNNLGHFHVSAFDKGFNKCIDEILQ